MSSSFHPPQRTLMGPGPSDVSPRVLQAMARPTIGHLDPVFVDFMDSVKELLQYAFQTSNALTMPVSGPGTVGMEACFVNLVQPGDTVIVCRNGVFGGRMRENVVRCGATAVVVDDPWGRAVDPEKLERALKEHPEAKLVAFVHAETSTGARSDAQLLAAIAHRHGCLVIADCVTAVGGIPVRVDEWGLDAVYSGSQKCLSCPPGLSPVTFGESAVEAHHDPVHAHPELVQRHEPDHGLLGLCPAQVLPPHRAGQRAVWTPRGAAHPPRGGPRERLGPPPPAPPRPQGRARGPRPGVRGARVGAIAPAQLGLDSRTASTMPGSGDGCSRSTTSRSGAGWASSPARCGGSGSWATAAN